MDELTEPTQALIARLHEHAAPSIWSRWQTGEDPRVALIYAIGEQGEAAAILHLLGYLLVNQKDVAQAAADVVDRLLFSMSVEDLIALDRRVRERSLWYYKHNQTVAWYRMKPAALQHIGFQGRRYTAFVALASFHPSGYVRERAVKLLTNLITGEELPFLLLRLNDWVEPVRTQATKAVHVRLVPEYASHFARALPLVFQLEERERHEVPELPEQIKTLLLDEQNSNTLRAGLSHPELAVRRSCYRIALQGPISLYTIAFEQGLEDADVLIRLRTAEAIRVRMPSLEGAYIDRMLENAFMPVRRHALRAVLENTPEEAEPYLRRALLDPHRSIRELARYYLRKRGITDFAVHYREALRGGERVSTLKAAIGGLGETGAAEDAEHVAPYLAADVVSVRRAALAAIAQLDGVTYQERVVTALQDDAPSVSRDAARLLAEHRDWVEAEALWRIFREDTHRYVRTHALSVLARLSRWQSLPYLIQVLDTDDPALAEQAQQHIDQWLSQSIRVFLGPTKDEAMFLQATLATHEHCLSDEAVASIHHLLTTHER